MEAHPNGFTLPARYYVDPDHFHREIDAIFGQMWICVGRSEELPRVGDYVVREIGNESVIIVRESSDHVHAFYNVCRHRGTRIIEHPTGHALRLQCPYHAWTYNLDGRLLAAPHFEADEQFLKSNYGLKAARCDLWDGHLFLNMSEDSPSLMEQLGNLPDKFDPWSMGTLRLGARVVYDVKANWKLIIQNYSECLHCPIIHPALQKVSHYLSGKNDPPGLNKDSLGGRMDLRDDIATMSFLGQAVRSFLPGLDADARRHVSYYAVLPNLLLSLHPDYMMTHVLRPLAMDRTEVTCEWHFHPDEMAKPDFDPSDAVDFWDLTNRQDWHVSELSQLGLKSRAYSPGPYSHREDLLHAFDQWLLTRLGEIQK